MPEKTALASRGFQSLETLPPLFPSLGKNTPKSFKPWKIFREIFQALEKPLTGVSKPSKRQGLANSGIVGTAAVMLIQFGLLLVVEIYVPEVVHAAFLLRYAPA